MKNPNVLNQRCQVLVFLFVGEYLNVEQFSLCISSYVVTAPAGTQTVFVFAVCKYYMKKC